MIAVAPHPESAIASTPGTRGGKTASPIICIGVSHRTAPVALRERLSLSPEATTALLGRFSCGLEARNTGVSELVVLSTCNRLELYASGGSGAVPTLLALIEQATGVTAADVEPVMYRLTGEDAVRHLCRTAAGLDSMVVGEPQILGQIGTAFQQAVSLRACAHGLAVLFRGAMRSGRRARAETGINRNPATISSVAVKLVSEHVRDLESAQVLVIGAGEMATLAVAAFHNRGVRNICVVSRTSERAARLSEQYEARATPVEYLSAELAEADIVITSTSARHHVLTSDMVQRAMSMRPMDPMSIVDIAVPRDVEPAVRGLANVWYWDLDDLQRGLDNAIAERNAEIPKVEAVVEDEMNRTLFELHQMEVQPLIADLRTRTEAIRVATLERVLRDLPALSESERTHIEAFSRSLVNKLLHEPTTRLKEDAKIGQASGYAMALRHLFGLES
jgi:glutamyl-tRNA reductase